ncbi:hypothetical protein MG290_06460 [Flavobacterium sp. CBA20B-1]|uniref:hypothetical protein n=1 Tax=unclassified Flavobacterium TaxID=196869 RepID=UPI002223F9FB|nr:MULTISPECIES: hypothetical protein [unclassified Flavobacterium]WCM43298.1 hypothetical protein MG290_06460 [Flavobacterium sp. CBA20B-1]
MKINIKGFITSKKSELYSDCADNYAVNIEHNKFSISDGVSKSFFPKVWSEILVNKYVNQKDWKDNNEFIVESQKEWQSQIDEIVAQPEVKYYTRNAYIKKTPALATFVGLQFIESEQKWIAQALGDSFLFFIPKGSTEIEIKLSTKPEPIVFDNFPDYLSSIGNSHKGEKKPIKGEKIKEGTFYLMTDALAEWFLSNTKHAKQTLDNIKTQEQYLETIENERNANRLNDDDSAVLILELFDDGKKEFSYTEPNIIPLSELIKKEVEDIEEAKKKEVSSQDSLNVNEEENKEEQLTEEESSEKEAIEQVELSIENENNEKESSEEKPLDENVKENTAEDNSPVENDNLSEQKQEEEKSSEPIQNIVSDNPKAKSIFDKF